MKSTHSPPFSSLRRRVLRESDQEPVVGIGLLVLLVFFWEVWVVRVGVGWKSVSVPGSFIAVVVTPGEPVHVPLPVRGLLHGPLVGVLADGAGDERSYGDHPKDERIEPVDHPRQFARFQPLYDFLSRRP